MLNRDSSNGRIESLQIRLASPEKISDEARGEVLKPETINYRSYKPEKDGLFCEKIFGPVKDWECHCGKYKGRRYKGIVCDRCGVEITKKDVRRKRMGKIVLAVPIVHIWFFRSLPSKIGTLLGISVKQLERVIYYEGYVVIDPGSTEAKKMDLLTESECNELREEDKKSEDSEKTFEAAMGGQAIKRLLAALNIDELARELREKAKDNSSQQRKLDTLKRLKVVEAFRRRDDLNQFINRPEWMILDVLPVIPPDLRPLVPLEGGRFATSDLNDLYRRVIIRNNRLKRLMEIKAPEVILRNEKRMLQEAVDSLFDNGKKSVAVRSDGNRPLKSLSDVLRGKQGRFRQNLLGKRVDYSGRSVITVGPDLELHQCGLPKYMAIELFKPFIIRHLLDAGRVPTVKKAKKMIDDAPSFVWEILEEVVQDHAVMLNRAPTLHRLGIQAFQPLLIEGKAIRLHPLVCTAFNADFDGDQMAVHVPLSFEAQMEAKYLMMANQNILHPASGRPITVPTQDIVLGCYYLTKLLPGARGEGMRFSSEEEVVAAHSQDQVDMHASIEVRMGQGKVKTTVGRILFNRILPEAVREKHFFNDVLNKKYLEGVILDVFNVVGHRETALFLDRMKELGFTTATAGGLSIGISDVLIPVEKQGIIDSTQDKVNQIQQNFQEGFLQEGERYNQVIDLWTHATRELSGVLKNHIRKDREGFNPLFMMLDSGARGSDDQIKQLAGMRGLMAKPQKRLTGSKGEIIENPITANFKEGLSVLEYFISTHGARKGLADTALKTADAGYLTRRLVDVAQDIVITEVDCSTDMGIEIQARREGEESSQYLSDIIVGRVLAQPIYDLAGKNRLFSEGTKVEPEVAEAIYNAGVESVIIRSTLTCASDRGVCAKCYGNNLNNNQVVHIGEAVGVMAAQSIGEPGTQLTLRTFHVGGIASLQAKEPQVRAKTRGKVELRNIFTITDQNKEQVTVRRNGVINIYNDDGRRLKQYLVPYGATLYVKDKEVVNDSSILYEWDPYNDAILAQKKGTIKFVDIKEEMTFVEDFDETTNQRTRVIIEAKNRKLSPRITIVSKDGKKIDDIVPPVGSFLQVKEGDAVYPGQILAKKLRESSKSRDITGGLPRVSELFEARRPRNVAVVSEIEGKVKFGDIKSGSREVFVIPSQDIEQKKYMVPSSKHILVHENEEISAGEPISEGSIAPQEILSILGPRRAQEYMVQEIQEVYRSQGVKINDKHIEIIVRQMLQRAQVIDPGDSGYLENDIVDFIRIDSTNREMQSMQVVIEPGDSRFYLDQLVTNSELADELNRLSSNTDNQPPTMRQAIPATSKRILMGITQAALTTESFISAASFQETTRVLTAAAINGRIDKLVGLKENLIMGNRIPAGTGLTMFDDLIVDNPDGEDEDQVEAEVDAGGDQKATSDSVVEKV